MGDVGTVVHASHTGTASASGTWRAPMNRSALAMVPDKQIAVVWMTNAQWLKGGDEITCAALDTALGLAPQPISAVADDTNVR